jgi:hypothetical protein
VLVVVMLKWYHSGWLLIDIHVQCFVYLSNGTSLLLFIYVLQCVSTCFKEDGFVYYYYYNV